MKSVSFLALLLCFSFLISGCSSTAIPFEETVRQEYIKNDRLEKYYDLQKRYNNTRVILWANQKEDSWWITNFSLWLIFSILPDMPSACATGSIIALFYAVAWWIGVTLTGGGILAVLAWMGAMFGGIPGIPPTIVGIIFLGTMFSIFFKIFSSVF